MTREKKLEVVKVNHLEIKPGNVIQLWADCNDAWDDAIVVKIREHDDGLVWITLVRPYMYVNLASTICETVLCGQEKVELTLRRLTDLFNAGKYKIRRGTYKLS